MKQYIRTKNNKLWKINDKYQATNNCGCFVTPAPDCERFLDQTKDQWEIVDIIAKSNNILDLIQVGDLVRIDWADEVCWDNALIGIEEVKDIKENCIVPVSFDNHNMCGHYTGINKVEQTITQIYTKQGNDYILVWDKERGVI